MPLYAAAEEECDEQTELLLRVVPEDSPSIPSSPEPLLAPQPPQQPSQQQQLAKQPLREGRLWTGTGRSAAAVSLVTVAALCLLVLLVALLSYSASLPIAELVHLAVSLPSLLHSLFQSLSSSYSSLSPSVPSSRSSSSSSARAPLASDYWPSMVTSVRQCPASPSSTVLLGAGSRWLVDPHSSIPRFAFTVSARGRLLYADMLSGDGPGVLLGGVGYGVAEWDLRRATTEEAGQTDANAAINALVGRLRQQQTASPTQPATAPPSSAAARLRFPFDQPDVLSSTSTAPLNVSIALDQLTAYRRDSMWLPFFAGRERGEPIMNETPGPWWELRLPNVSGHGDMRALFFGTELVLADSTGRGPHSSTTAMVLHARGSKEQKSGFMQHISGEDAAGDELFSHFSCSFTADIDDEQLRERRGRNSSSDQQLDLSDGALQAQLFELHSHTAVVYARRNKHSWGDAGWDLECPLPAVVQSSPHFLDQHSSGPLLRLRSLQFHLTRDTITAYHFATVSLPLCLVRTRRSHSSLMLGQALFSPQINLDPDNLHTWLQYHLFMGVQQIHIVDRFGWMYPSLLPYMQAGLMDYYRWPALLPFDGLVYLDQILITSTLQQHARLSSEWVLEMDTDEFFTPVHPYFTENEQVVQPPQLDCYQSQRTTADDAAAAAARAAEEPHNVSIAAPQYCVSILSRLLSLATDYSVRNFVVPSVPMHGLSPAVDERLQAQYREEARLRESWSEKLAELSTDQHWAAQLAAASQPPHSRALLLDRLVWSELSVSPQLAVPSSSVLELFPRRMKGMDGSRPKHLFTPLHVGHINQHQLWYHNGPAAAASVHRYEVESDTSSFFPNAGANRWRRRPVQSLDIPTNVAAVDLVSLYCATSSSFPSSPQLTDCCKTASSAFNATQRCLAQQLNVEQRQWELATLSPLFPLVSSGGHSIPLSIVAHMSHYFCSSRSRHQYAQCSVGEIVARSLKGWQPAADVSTVPVTQAEIESFEEEEDAALKLTRQRVREWRVKQWPWTLHRDQREYWQPQRSI